MYQVRETEMNKIIVNLLELSDSQKTKFLEEVKAYLQQQVEEERYCRSISLSSLDKDNMEKEVQPC